MHRHRCTFLAFPLKGVIQQHSSSSLGGLLEGSWGKFLRRVLLECSSREEQSLIDLLDHQENIYTTIMVLLSETLNLSPDNKVSEEKKDMPYSVSL